MRLTKKVNLDKGKPNYCEPTHLEEYETKNKHLAINKLGQLEDIEEELGIDLITLFNALKNGAYVKNYNEKQDLALKEDKLYLCPLDIYDDFVYIKDYGKTWALDKKEEL